VPPEVLARVASGYAASTSAAVTERLRRRSSMHSGHAGPYPSSGRAQSLASSRASGIAAARWPPPTSLRHLVADFGRSVPLGETRQMYLMVTNRTAMHTSIRTWLERFGVEDASRFTRRPGERTGAGEVGGGGRRSASGGPLAGEGSAATGRRPSVVEMANSEGMREGAGEGVARRAHGVRRREGERGREGAGADGTGRGLGRSGGEEVGRECVEAWCAAPC
jgi:hypothetical protein